MSGPARVYRQELRLRGVLGAVQSVSPAACRTGTGAMASASESLGGGPLNFGGTTWRAEELEEG